MDNAIDQERLAEVVKLLTQSLQILDVTEQTQAALHVSLALEALGVLTNSND
ncbi:hypothetical protein [Novosphingobium sp. B1]|uniref:hypothetical protein n=1 Tax=Novosphingobium sp. B1 TaxID=1938756 RepID=UPI0009D8274D|nr:hypothetical protein [Novosphingobium sp. B1]SMD10396.1 hypothetical protein SAMN06272759_1472 [Novosphingobium sp. B1]